MKKTIHSVCLLLCLTLLITLLVPGTQNTARAAGQNIDVHFNTFFFPTGRDWAFPYDDALFLEDSDSYSHELARSSLGLALASGRSKQGTADSSIRSFLSEAGFEELESADYLAETSRDTIASMLGHKTLPNGETLLVIGISGHGYKNEWLSNLDVGNEQEHRGFSSAAAKVVDRVIAYMEKHQISGNCRLWTSGYSRAAAVSNLVSASLMEQGFFSTKNAFVYTFATPRTTKTPVAYPNLFNIIGKFDPATKIPYAEWGFGRHGVDLFTPAQETDSDFRQKLVLCNNLFQQLTGIPYQNNPNINHNFTIISEYLTSIIPNSAYYDSQMYHHMENVWQNPNLMTLRSLLHALSTPVEMSTLTDMQQKQQVDDLVDYLSGIVYGIVSETLAGSDSATTSATEPLLLEHKPEVYIAWMFAFDDPGMLFSDQLNYLHLILDGNAEVTLFDQRGGFVLTLYADGQYTEETNIPNYLRRIRPLEDRPLIATTTTDKRILTLPKDQGMPFVIDALSNDVFSYYGVEYHIDRCQPTATDVRMINMEAGEQYLAFSFTPDGMMRMQADDSVWGDADTLARIAEDSFLLSVETTAELEGFNAVNIDVKSILIIAVILLFVLLVLLIVLLVFLIRLLLKLFR